MRGVLIVLLVAIVLVIGFIPTIMNTAWGTRKITECIQKRVPGKLHINKLHLTWFSGQTLEGLTLQDEEQKVLVSLDRLSTNDSLFKLIFNEGRPTNLSLGNLNATVTDYPTAKLGQALLHDKKRADSLQNLLGPTISLHTSHQADVKEPWVMNVESANLKAALKGFVDNAIHFDLSGETRGDIKPMTLKMTGEVDLAALFNQKIDLKAHVTEFSLLPLKELSFDLQKIVLTLQSVDKDQLQAKLSGQLTGLGPKFSQIPPFHVDVQTNIPTSNTHRFIPQVEVYLTRPEVTSKATVTLQTDNSIHVDLTGALTNETKPATFTAEADITAKSFSPFELEQIESTANVVRFPVLFLSNILNQKDLSPLFGNAVDLQMNLSFTSDFKNPGYLDLFIDSKQLHSRARVKIDDTITLYESTKPTAEIRWEITPAAYEFLKKWKPEWNLPALTLVSPSTLTISALNLLVPLKNGKAQLNNSQLELQASLAPIEWKNETALPPLRLQGHAVSKSLSDKLTLSLEGLLNESVIASVKTTAANPLGGVLLLSEPLKVECHITPASQQLFSHLKVPALEMVQSADKPINLTVEPKGFSLPLNPFNLSQASIGKATLDLGKINFKNEGMVKTITSMIHPDLHKELNVWFTPIYFNLAKGKLNLERFDFLVGNLYPLACWGNYNLVNEQGDMTLGIPNQTLMLIYRIPKLSESDFVQIPFKIKKGQVQLDKERLAAKISSLIAQKQSGKAIKWLNPAIDILFSGEEEAAPPKPTTSPFPWE